MKDSDSSVTASTASFKKNLRSSALQIAASEAISENIFAIMEDITRKENFFVSVNSVSMEERAATIEEVKAATDNSLEAHEGKESSIMDLTKDVHKL